MIITWYKNFFSISVKYQTTGSPSSTGISLEPAPSTRLLFDQHKMRCRFNPGKIDIYVPAVQTDSTPAITPLFPLELNELLFFKLNLDDHSLLDKLKLFPDVTSQELGFPLLFTGIKTNLAATPVALQYEKTKVLPGIGSYPVKSSDAGLNAITFSSFTLKDPSDKVIYTGDAAKNSDGFFDCSYDLSLSPPGIHTIGIGTFSKKIFLDTRNEFTDSVILIQVTRNDKIKYPSTLTSNSFVNFTQTIQKL